MIFEDLKRFPISNQGGMLLLLLEEKEREKHTHISEGCSKKIHFFYTSTRYNNGDNNSTTHSTKHDDYTREREGEKEYYYHLIISNALQVLMRCVSKDNFKGFRRTISSSLE